MKKLFNNFDSDHDGKLSKKEAKKFFTKAHKGKKFSDKEFKDWFESIDTDNNDLLSEPEFFNYLQSQITEPSL